MGWVRLTDREISPNTHSTASGQPLLIRLPASTMARATAPPSSVDRDLNPRFRRLKTNGAGAEIRSRGAPRACRGAPQEKRPKADNRHQGPTPSGGGP